MTDPFGVSKSFLRGVAKPASELTAAERLRLRTSLAARKGARERLGIASGPLPGASNAQGRTQAQQFTREQWAARSEASRRGDLATPKKKTNTRQGSEGFRWQPSRRQYQNIAGGLIIGPTALGVAHHESKKVSKADRKPRDYAPEAAGAVGGLALGRSAWEGGGWGAKRTIDAYQRRANEKAKTQPPKKAPTPLRAKDGSVVGRLGFDSREREIRSSMQQHYRRQTGKDTPPSSADFRRMSHKQKQSYFLNYPKDVPGGRARRLLATKNRPSVAVTFGVGTAAAGAAVGHHMKEKVGKSADPFELSKRGVGRFPHKPAPGGKNTPPEGMTHSQWRKQRAKEKQYFMSTLPKKSKPKKGFLDTPAAPALGLTALSVPPAYALTKRDAKRDAQDAASAAGGAAVGYGAYLGGGNAISYPLRTKTQEAMRNDRKLRQIWTKHRYKSGMRPDGSGGMAARNKAYRTMPDALPYAKVHRTLAATHGAGKYGKPAVAIPVAISGAATGYGLSHNRKIEKSTTQMVLDHVAQVGPKAAFEGAVLIPQVPGLLTAAARNGKTMLGAKRYLRRVKTTGKHRGPRKA